MFDPIQRRRYGVIALFLSMILFAVSAAAYAGNAISRNSVAKERTAQNQECQNRLKLLGAQQVSMTETQATANWPLDGGYGALSSASSAALACPGWTMSNFCMGAGCSAPGATLTLKRADS